MPDVKLPRAQRENPSKPHGRAITMLCQHYHLFKGHHVRKTPAWQIVRWM